MLKSTEAPVTDDSRVREHLANERTYLAWLRTGISTMGFGVLIAKLRWLFTASTLTPPSQEILRASQIGVLFTVFGLLTVIFAVQRFLVIRKQIRTNQFEASGTSLVVYAAFIIGLGVLIVWYLVESAQIRP